MHSHRKPWSGNAILTCMLKLKFQGGVCTVCNTVCIVWFQLEISTQLYHWKICKLYVNSMHAVENKNQQKNTNENNSAMVTVYYP